MKKTKKREKKLLPLQKQLIHLLIVFVFCVISILVWSITDYIKVQRENLDEYLELYAGHLAQTARQSYTSYENIAYSVAYNTIVQEYIQETNSVSRYELYQQVYNLLNNTAKLNSNLSDIAVISADNGNSISLTTSPALYSSFFELLSAPSYAFQSVGTLSIRGADCHILSMPIHQLTTSGQNRYLGTVFLAIHTQRFFAANLDGDQNESTPEILLIDDANRLIYGNEKLYHSLSDMEMSDASQRISIDGNVYAARMYTITEAGSQLYVLFDSSYYTRASVQISLRLSAGICLVMLFILFYFIAVCFPVSASLRRLTGVMEDITTGGQRAIRQGVDVTNVKFECTEIRDIYNAFSTMIQEIDNLNHTIFNTYTKMYDLEMNNRLTEIAFLRSQINPHFLYNTLTTICGMSAAGMNDKIIDVANALSQIFRYSICGGDMVALSKELEIVHSYLMIQSCRFEDRFSVEYQIQEETHDLQIPKMIIQPLVENAIVHGLEPSLQHGRLIIQAVLDKDEQYLTISIMDTGVGMSAQKLNELRTTLYESVSHKSSNAQDNLAAYDSKSHDSIGIYNVNSRIVLYYGEEYALKLDSWENVGTNIQIRIPANKMP